MNIALDLANVLNMLFQYSGLSEKFYPLVLLEVIFLTKFSFDCDEFYSNFIDRHIKMLNIYKDHINQFYKIFSDIDTLVKFIRIKEVFWSNY